MTNRTPKTEYDANPGLANDQNADYRIPGSKIESSGTAVPVSMSIQQMRSLVGNVDNPTPPPAAGSFSAVMQAENQLLVSITATIDFTADQYTYTIAGVSKTVTGTVTGTFSTTDTLADWNNNTITMTAINAEDQSTVTLTPSIDNGSGGFDVKAVDSIAGVYPIPSMIITQGASPGEIDVELFETDDAGSGPSGNHTIKQDDGTVMGFVTIPAGASSAKITISGLTPGTTYQLYPTTQDIAGNVTDNPTRDSVGATPVAGTGGVISLVASPDVTENASTTPFKITARITGRSVAGVTSCTLSTVDETAKSQDSVASGSENFTDLNSQTVQFPDTSADADVEVDVTLFDRDLTTNKVFTAQLDLGSADNGASIASEQSKQAILCKILGTGAISGDHFGNSGTPYYETNLDAVDATGVINAAGTWATATFDSKTTMRQGTSLPGFGSDPDPYNNAPRIDFDIDMEAGEYDLWIKTGSTASSANSWYVYMDGADAFVPAGTTMSTTVDSTLAWEKHAATVTVSAGRHILSLTQREARSPYVQQIYLAKTGSGYTDPTGDLTPDSLTGGTVGDDPANPVTPTYPSTSTTVSPTNTQPAEGTSVAQPASTIKFIFSGMTGLTVTQNLGMTRNSLPIGGVWSSDTVNVATFTPALPLDYDATYPYILKLDGTINDGGVIKTIDPTFQLTFRTTNTGSSDILFSQDFSGIPTQTAPQGYAYTVADATADFQVGELGYDRTSTILGTDIESGSGVTREQGVFISPDPAGGTSRGNVMEVTTPVDRAGFHMNISSDFWDGTKHTPYVGGPEEIYMYHEMYFPTDWEPTQAHKACGVKTGSKLDGGHAFQVVPYPTGLGGFTCRFRLDNLPAPGDSGWRRGVFFPAGMYTYDARESQRTVFLDTVDPAAQNVDNQYNMSLGSWVGIEIHVKMNTSVELLSVTDVGGGLWEYETADAHNLNSGDRVVIYGDNIPNSLAGYTDYSGGAPPYNSQDQNPGFPRSRTVASVSDATHFRLTNGKAYSGGSSYYVNAHDGLYECRITDPAQGFDAHLMYTSDPNDYTAAGRLIRWTPFMRIDMLGLRKYSGGPNEEPNVRLQIKRNSCYYDNFIVSKSPIVSTGLADIDPNNPPTDLSKTATAQSYTTDLGAGGLTITHQEFIGTSFSSTILAISNQTGPIVIENCIFRDAASKAIDISSCSGGVLIRNNRFIDSGRTDPSDTTTVKIRTCTGDLRVLGNYFTGCMGGVETKNNDGATRVQIRFNHYASPQASGTKAGRGEHAFEITGTGETTPLSQTSEISDNITIVPRTGSPYHGDHINTSTSVFTSGAPLLVERNYVEDSSISNFSMVGIQLGDDTNNTVVPAYEEIRHNTIVDVFSGAGLNISAGQNMTVENNDLFTAVGNPASNSGSSNCLSVYPFGSWVGSNMTGHTVQNNNYSVIKQNDLVNSLPIFYDSAASVPEPTGWATNVDKTSTWQVVAGNGKETGYNELQGRRRTTGTPSALTGVITESADYDAAVGVGVITWNDTNNTLSWAESGDTAGTPVDVTTGADAGRYYLASNNGKTLRVYITDVSALPVGDATYQVEVTNTDYTGGFIYAGTTGLGRV